MNTMMVPVLMGANEQQLRTFLIGVVIAFLLAAAALAFLLHASSKKHSVLGWFIRIVAGVAGGLAGASVSLIMDSLPKSVLDTLPDFVTVSTIVAFMALGAWLALKVVSFVQKPQA